MTILTIERDPLAELRLHVRFGVWFVWTALRRWLALETRITTSRHALKRRAVAWPELVVHYVVAVFVVTTIVVTSGGERIETSSALGRAWRFTLRGVAFCGLVALTWWGTR